MGLALAGAGCFDPKLDPAPDNPVYTQWVQEKMVANKLACVTAGKEFTWGANVPAFTVVVTKSFAETTSVAGMLQYVGRAARRGLATHGQAIFEREEDIDRIFASPDGLSTEARTMERYAKWWRSGGSVWDDDDGEAEELARSSRPKFCSVCGKPLDSPTIKSCSQCGTKIVRNEAPWTSPACSSQERIAEIATGEDIDNMNKQIADLQTREVIAETEETRGQENWPICYICGVRFHPDNET